MSGQPPAFGVALAAGGCAGMAVDTLFFPIDTLKTRLQSQAGFWAAGGFKSIYRGLGGAFVGSAPGAAFFFTTYEYAKGALPRLLLYLGTDDGAPLLHMASASLGETAACLIRVPTEVVKQRSQASAGTISSLQSAKGVWSSAGLAGFYRGFGSTVAREIPFTCIQFPLYERFKKLAALRRTKSGKVQDLPPQEAALCGSVAGGIAAGITTPLDVCKTRIMLSGKHKSDAPAAAPEAGRPTRTVRYPSSLFKTLGIIFREEGVGVIFSGVVPRVAWISFGGAVFLGVYEATKKELGSRVPPTLQPEATLR